MYRQSDPFENDQTHTRATSGPARVIDAVLFIRFIRFIDGLVHKQASMTASVMIAVMAALAPTRQTRQFCVGSVAMMMIVVGGSPRLSLLLQ